MFILNLTNYLNNYLLKHVFSIFLDNRNRAAERTAAEFARAAGYSMTSSYYNMLPMYTNPLTGLPSGLQQVLPSGVPSGFYGAPGAMGGLTIPNNGHPSCVYNPGRAFDRPPLHTHNLMEQLRGENEVLDFYRLNL